MKDFKTKKLKADDIQLAIELIEMFGFSEGSRHQKFSSPEYIRLMLERDDFHVIVGLENDKLIGGLTAYEMQMFKRETTEMFLYEIEVAESHRRQRVGTALIECLKKICVEKGIVELFVGTEKDNISARRLYTTTGGKMNEDLVWFNYLFE